MYHSHTVLIFEVINYVYYLVGLAPRWGSKDEWTFSGRDNDNSNDDSCY